MERTQLFDLMGELKLYGMEGRALTRSWPRPSNVSTSLSASSGICWNAEINEKQARARWEIPALTIAKLPLAKDLDDFQFEGTPINQTLVNDLGGGDFTTQQRNAVLVGGSGTGKTCIWAIAIARSCIRSGVRGRFYNVRSISSTGSRPRPVTAGKAGSPTISPGWTSSSSTNLAICPSSLNQAANSCSTSSAGSTSAPRSSSPRTSPSGSGRASSAIRR